MSDAKINDVSDTALWVAAYRAAESERPDAIFRDPFAARLAGERGRLIAGTNPTGSAHTGWSVVMRTRVIDEVILERVRAGVDTVINLGAGLDARPYRLELPTSLRWIEVDFPHMIALKESRLSTDQPKCRLERVRLDLSNEHLRREFLERVNIESKQILVLTEGVTPYLTESQVASLARDLRAQPHVRFWIADYFSPRVMNYLKRASARQQMQKSPFQFFPADWFAFFAAQGWKPREIRYLGEEAEKFGRPMPMPSWVRWLQKILRFKIPTEMKRSTAYVLLERSGSN